jgi:uncharacterized membrane protein YoaK (UPF0700 family)/anti-anti-sigma regulatory factor
MLSASAYSLRQQSRLAISLSWVGGYTNIIAFLVAGTGVSHVTGNTTQLGRSLMAGDWHGVMFFGTLLVMFISGAVLSAVMTESARRNGWRSKYILPIALEAALLGVITILLTTHLTLPGHIAIITGALASLAMGLQNATITKVSGAVIRTTHLTGICTDLGLESVQYFFWYKDRMARRRWERAGRLLRISLRHPSAQRLLLLASIAGSFSVGVLAGSLAFFRWGGVALCAPVCFLLAMVCITLRRPIADVRDMDMLNDPELKMHHLLTQILPPEVLLYRSASAHGNRSHRAPDFQLWRERIPGHCRVAILAVSPFTRFDSNAVMDLAAAAKSLQGRGCTLIISGITTVQFKALAALGVERLMDINNLCTDLEFAIARALAIHPVPR